MLKKDTIINKWKIKLIFLTLSFMTIISCMSIDNPKERNKLVFNNETEEVMDSVNAMNNLMKKSYFNPFAYAITDKNELYIINYQLGKSSYRIGLLSDTLLYKNDSLNFLDKTYRKRFLNLCQYLNKNYLERCDLTMNEIDFTYRSNIYMADKQNDLNRIVVFSNSANEIDLNRFKILDNYKNLYLLADKDADIYAGKEKH